MKKIILFLSLSLLIVKSQAQPATSAVNLVISPNHSDWIYSPGQTPELDFYVLKNGCKVNDIIVKYEYGPERMTYTKDSVIIKKNEAHVKLPTMKVPGFQKVSAVVTVGDYEYKKTVTLAYSPEKIEPTVSLPDDFNEFWNKAKEKAAEFSFSPKMVLVPEKCTDKSDVYYVKFRNDAENHYVYGVLCMPKKPGKYPALLRVPGAGMHSFPGNDVGLADKGMVTLEIGIHGVPVNLSQEVIGDIMGGPLGAYPRLGAESRDTYYYKRVFIGCSRSIDFLCSLDNVDDNRVCVVGGSQGGALSIVTAGLNHKVKNIIAFCPALCDLTGFLHGRAGGWPYFFSGNADKYLDKERVSKEVLPYFDVVNFAKNIGANAYMSWGYDDPICPPTSMQAMYNSLPQGYEHILQIMLDSGHWIYKEVHDPAMKWLFNKLEMN